MVYFLNTHKYKVQIREKDWNALNKKTQSLKPTDDEYNTTKDERGKISLRVLDRLKSCFLNLNWLSLL